MFNLFLTVLGLCCCLDFSCGKQGLLSSCSVQASRCCGFSCEAQALGLWPSVAVAHGLSCSRACGIFPDQEMNLCLLHWQADSLPLSYQRSPMLCPGVES